MNIGELLETLGVTIDYEQDEEILSKEVECHFQRNYPLKGILENVRMLNGKVTLAVGDGTEYGDSDAWEGEY